MKDPSEPRLNSYYGGTESCFVNGAGLERKRESALKGIFLLTGGSLLMEGRPVGETPVAWPSCSTIPLELVLRGTQQECAHNPNEISAFHAELVLRDIPGKLA